MSRAPLPACGGLCDGLSGWLSLGPALAPLSSLRCQWSLSFARLQPYPAGVKLIRGWGTGWAQPLEVGKKLDTIRGRAWRGNFTHSMHDLGFTTVPLGLQNLFFKDFRMFSSLKADNIWIPDKDILSSFILYLSPLPVKSLNFFFSKKFGSSLRPSWNSICMRFESLAFDILIYKSFSKLAKAKISHCSIMEMWQGPEVTKRPYNP